MSGVMGPSFRGDAKDRATMCTAHRRISRFRVRCWRTVPEWRNLDFLAEPSNPLRKLATGHLDQAPSMG